MMLDFDDRNLLARALAQDESAISALRSSVGRDPSKKNPHYFKVREDGLIFDTLMAQPKIRREVMNHFPRFGMGFYGNDPRRTQCHWKAVSSSFVISKAQPFAILMRRFADMAFEDLDQLESELITKERLSRLERKKRLMKIQSITDPGDLVWKNWVNSLDKSDFVRVDAVFQGWLNEPIDWREQDFFDFDWEDHFDSNNSAKEFFDKLKNLHKAYLGVNLCDFNVKGKILPKPFYELIHSVQEANKRARALGFKFRFRK